MTYRYRRPAPRPKRRGLQITLGIIGGLVALIIIGAIIGGSKKSTPPGASPTATPAAAATTATTATPRAKPRHVRQTVTYVVTGSPASVTYGPAGTNLNGSVPMRVTRPLGNPVFYSISVQLQGGGAVACKLLVNGRVISRASATGGYNIASCEISQDPISGKWSDTNGG